MVGLDEERERYMSDLERGSAETIVKELRRVQQVGATSLLRCVAMEAADRIEALEAELEHERNNILSLRDELELVGQDARRYQWLRCRVVVRTQESLAGSKRPGLDIAIGGTYFDVLYSARDYEVSKLDAAIDAVLNAGAADQNVASARRPDEPDAGAGITSQDTPQG
jgi:hypothetical protein